MSAALQGIAPAAGTTLDASRGSYEPRSAKASRVKRAKTARPRPTPAGTALSTKPLPSIFGESGGGSMTLGA